MQIFMKCQNKQIFASCSVQRLFNKLVESYPYILYKMKKSLLQICEKYLFYVAF